MIKQLKKGLFIITIIGIIGFCLTLVTDIIIKNKIENYLDNRLPKNIKQKYKHIIVSSFYGDLIIINPDVEVLDEKSKKVTAKIKVDTLTICDLSYWNYLFKNKIEIENIYLRSPKIKFYKYNVEEPKDSTIDNYKTFKKKIEIDNFNFKNAEISIINGINDSMSLAVNNLDLRLNKITIDSTTILKQIPFIFEDYSLSTGFLFFKMNDYDNLFIKNSKIERQITTLHGFKIKTKYSKEELSRLIILERDHYDITIDSVVIKNQDFGFQNDKFYYKSPSVQFNQPNINIYRDKLITDSEDKKVLYSEMLRELPFSLTLDSLRLVNAKVTYAEKVKEDKPAGELIFSNFNADIENFSNTYHEQEKTRLKIHTLFMDTTPLDVLWTFNINDTSDHFNFKAELETLPAAKMNSFTEFNLGVRLEGEIKKTYFTFYGNDETSKIDLMLNYDDFKITVLEKNGKEKKPIFSAIVNLLFSKDSKELSNNMRKGTGEVTREKNKSFYSYLWSNVQTGLMDAMTGDGKK